jgi:hypothetical protein
MRMYSSIMGKLLIFRKLAMLERGDSRTSILLLVASEDVGVFLTSHAT